MHEAVEAPRQGPARAVLTATEGGGKEGSVDLQCCVDLWGTWEKGSAAARRRSKWSTRRPPSARLMSHTMPTHLTRKPQHTYRGGRELRRSVATRNGAVSDAPARHGRLDDLPRPHHYAAGQRHVLARLRLRSDAMQSEGARRFVPLGRVVGTCHTFNWPYTGPFGTPNAAALTGSNLPGSSGVRQR